MVQSTVALTIFNEPYLYKRMLQKQHIPTRPHTSQSRKYSTAVVGSPAAVQDPWPQAMDLRYRVLDQSESRTSDIKSYTRKADCNQSANTIVFHNLLMVFISAYILTFVIICGLVPMNTESTRSRLLLAVTHTAPDSGVAACAPLIMIMESCLLY